MRVVQLIDTLNAGGAERVAVNYANMLSSEISSSFLVTSRESGVLEEELGDNVVYINLNKKSTFDFSAVIRFKKFLKSNNINIIHAHTTSYFFAVLTKFFCKKIKVIWHDHQGNRDELSVLKQIPLIISSFFFNGVITVNDRLESWAKKHLFNSHVAYIENFISSNDFESKKTILFGKAGKRMINVANLKNPKNHKLLLKCFLDIYKRNPDWSLHLIGEDYMDSYSNKLYQFIEDNSLHESVFIYGSRQDIHNILTQCEIGIITSTFEGLPMALLEYGYARLAVITTDVGNCGQLVNGRGIVVESNDEVQLSNAMNLLINDPDLRKDYGNRIKEYIDQNFTKTAVCSKAMDFYRLIEYKGK